MSEKEKLISAAKKLCALGPVLAVTSGSNAVGKTMQKYLGIDHSVTQRNSLFGYTITSTLAKNSLSGRTNLFACVPNWGLSRVKSSKELLLSVGREDNEKGYSRSLFCTVSTKSKNSFGLELKSNSGGNNLDELFNGSPIVTWEFDKLVAKLGNLSNTAILSAVPVSLNGQKAFHYRYLDILGSPKLEAFKDLLDDGAITLDHLISMKVGSSVAREQGPLFKISASARGELYGNPYRIDLTD
jgi:hypothetical protein